MSADLEVADVFRRHGDAYRRAHDGHLGRVERRVMSAIELCRTAALGGHAEHCADCGLIRIAYNSCRNRHCPKCQGQARAEWLAARQAELLPVPYFHVVFTLPAPVAEIAFQNKAGGLRHPVPRRGRDAAHDRRRPEAPRRRDRPRRRAPHLGPEPAPPSARPLRRARRRPRRPTATRWIACRPGFFLPVRVLSRLFRRLFLDELHAAFDGGGLGFFGDARRARRVPLPSPAACARCAGSNGWSTPSRPSAAPSRCWPISAATPIASPSPTRRLVSLTDDAGQLPLEGLSPSRQAQGHDA